MEKLYLIGKGIAHSKSPAMYNVLYEHLGLDWSYELANCETEEQARAVLAQDWLSLNATMPYKPLALDAAHVQAASVQLAGGANMLMRKESRIVALNTDGVGCVRSIQRQGFSFTDARVVVCGTGPTALAIVAAAAAAGASRIALLGRKSQRAQQVLEAFLARYKQLAYATLELAVSIDQQRTFREAYEMPDYLFGSYETSTEEIQQANIVIDATPLGMQENDPAPFAAELLGAQQLVFDVVYGHGTSKLLAAAQQAGVATLDGQGMLVAQAVENAAALLDLHGIEQVPSWEDMFVLMAAAAGFAC